MLPDDLKEKEELEKKKVQEAMGAKKFEMHLPEKLAGKKDLSGLAKSEQTIKIGLEQKDQPQKRGIFRIKKKPELRSVLPTPPTPSIALVPPIPPLPRPIIEVKQPPADSTFRMKIPQIIDKLNGTGKKIIRETADEIEDVKTSKSLASLFQRGLAVIRFKKPPAEINLISEDYVGIVRTQFWRRLNVLLVVILMFLLLFSGVFLVIKFEKIKLAGEYSGLMQSISQTEAEINSFSSDQLQADNLYERAKILQVLLENHIYWTALFDELEHNIAKDVYYTNFVAESNGDILLTAKTKTYHSVAEQLQIFQKADFVQSVEVSSASQSAEETVDEFAFETEMTEPELPANYFPIEFNITLHLMDNALLK